MKVVFETWIDIFFGHWEYIEVFGSRECNVKLVFTGFGEIMGTLAKIGFFESDVSLILTNKDKDRPTYRTFLFELLKIESRSFDESVKPDKLITERIIELGFCKENGTAIKTAKAIM